MEAVPVSSCLIDCVNPVSSQISLRYRVRSPKEDELALSFTKSDAKVVCHIRID